MTLESFVGGETISALPPGSPSLGTLSASLYQDPVATLMNDRSQLDAIPLLFDCFCDASEKAFFYFYFRGTTWRAF